MTDAYFASLMLSGGVCLGFALHSWMLLRRSHERSHRLLLALSLLEAAYCVTAYAYFRELRPEVALHLVQAICTFTPFITYIFGELVMELTGHGDDQPRWFRTYQRVNLGLVIAFSLLVAIDGVWGVHLVTGLVESDLASRHRHRLSFPPLGEAWLMWVSVSFVLFSALLYRGYRVRRHLLPMVLGCGVYFAATISDFGILTGLYDAYFVQHFGYFAVVTGCWWVLAGRYEVSLRELRDVVSGLEEQRRRLLISAPLVHQHKLDGIGALAAGVAHEINNPVQGIMNYAELLKKRVGDEVALGFVGEILEECFKVAGIVRALLSLSRKDDTQVGEVSVGDIVGDIVRLARHALGVEGVRIETEIPKDVPEVCEGAQQLRQVLMNLVTNACDALRVREATRRDDKRLRIVVTTRGDVGATWLVVDTIDNADGIEAGLVDRIFDPFFTTKPVGRGTGLGLAISQELLSGRGGRLTCQTVRGKGSCFRVELPLASRGPASAARRRRSGDERKTVDLDSD